MIIRIFAAQSRYKSVGDKSPLFYWRSIMPDRERLITFVEEKVALKGGFLVDIHMSQSNHIQVFVDHPEGFSIDDSVALSREITAEFDRDKEDYDLEVSSPGLSQPLKVLPQYHKNLGRQVEVLMTDGTRIKGTLLSVLEDKIVVETREKKKLENKKGKKMVIEQSELPFSGIKSTKVVVSFK